MNNVLIIEDDKEICVMIKDHLEKYNYQVFFTLTGANAIERIKELSPDLIILDLMLPFISGDELIRTIRKFSNVPVIVVSAKSLTFNYVENAGKVSALLSANNITIYQLAQSGDSLETYYTNLIGGCQND